MSDTGMSESQRNDIATLKYKIDQGTATPAEEEQYNTLFETYQCDDEHYL